MSSNKWDHPKIDHIADLTLYLMTKYPICSVLMIYGPLPGTSCRGVQGGSGGQPALGARLREEGDGIRNWKAEDGQMNGP